MMPSEHVAPILLTHVCRTWRDVALSTPQLWSGLRLKISHDLLETETPRTLRRYSRILRTYLSRSGKVDLSLDIDLSSLYEGQAALDVTNRNLVSTLVSSILPYSQQWHHLSLAAPLQYLAPVMDLVSSGKAKRLASLMLDYSCDTVFPDFGMGGGELLPFTVMLSASYSERLSALTIYGNADDRVILNCDPESLPKSLSHAMLWNVLMDTRAKHGQPLLGTPIENSLRSLCLSALISTEDLLHILQVSPGLVELTLDVQVWIGDFASESVRIIQLENLRRLRICVGELTSKLLDRLHVPSLSFLEFTTEGLEVRGLLPRLTNLLQRSKPPIIFCMVCDGLGNAREEELIDLLQSMKSLEELRILKHGIGDRILRALTVKDATDIPDAKADCSDSIMLTSTVDLSAKDVEVSLCPRLISITFTAGNNFSPQCIIDLLVSRCSTHHRRSEEMQPPLSSGESLSGITTVPTTTYHSQGQSNDESSGVTVPGNFAQIATLKVFQAVLEQSAVVMENDAVRRCIDQGLKLHLREQGDFIPFLR